MVKTTLACMNLDWFGLKEAKLSYISEPLISHLVGFQDVGFPFSQSVESAGGILCVWDSVRFLAIFHVCQ